MLPKWTHLYPLSFTLEFYDLHYEEQFFVLKKGAKAPYMTVQNKPEEYLIQTYTVAECRPFGTIGNFTV